MGTLTGNQTRLPEYCEHKLPTSCRLSSIPSCCACADERAHATSYSTYIDGIGFVLRGTRWQRYCWFCKEFWQERVRISGLRSGQTRIPEVPVQTDFLNKWYEFHQGYRIVVKEDGAEERVAVLGEEFKDVSPGCLPRTLEELRSGRRREEVVQQAQSSAAQEQQERGPSLEDTLEQMFAAVSSESDERSGQPSNAVIPSAQRPTPIAQGLTAAPSNIHARVMNPAGPRSREYQMRRVAALRRELNRMRNGIERVITGLRDLGEDVPNYSETTGRLTALGDTLDTIAGPLSDEEAQRAISNVNELADSATAQTGTERTAANLQIRVDDARAKLEEARRARDQAAIEFDVAEQEFLASRHRFNQIQHEQRTTENYMRIFGTREEVLAQGESYVSPIGHMFSRAEERFRAAEEVRREQRTLRQVLEEEARPGSEYLDNGHLERRLSQLEPLRRDIWGVPQMSSATAGDVVEPDAAESILQNTEQPQRSQLGIAASSFNHDIETPPALIPTADESRLEEYYAMLRRQDQARADANADNSGRINTALDHTNQEPANNFQNMLEAVVAARERELAVRNLHDDSSPVRAGEQELDARPISPLISPQVSHDDWWHDDANHIIRALTSDDELRDEIGMSPQEASVLLTYFIDDVVSESDRIVIDGLMRNPSIIWRTGLPAEWIKRRQDAHPRSHLTFLIDDEVLPGASDWAAHYDQYISLEVVAQAFQMSAAIRYAARSLTPPQRLQMLYRLQAGRREIDDLRVLREMKDDGDTWHQALATYRERTNPHNQERQEVREALMTIENRRFDMARNGDHSRDGLDIRRRDTTQAFALAAGRQAMQMGPQALIQRQADQDEGTRAAYRRLENNGLINREGRIVIHRRRRLFPPVHDSDSETDSDSDRDDVELEARGLDARDSGRPEPKDDAELQMQMDCKICYTQVAETACLPCGHLVMCRWCSDQHSPTMQHDHTRPRRAANCPVCRKGIRQKVRVYRA